MCSIFGTTIKDEEKLKNMGIAGEKRGTDATGVASIGEEEIRITKSPVKASKFDWNKVEYEGNFDLYLGHTRKTTKGKESKNQNNHPFISEDNKIVLAHNGVISNDNALRDYVPKKDRDDDYIKTDSYAIVEKLQEEKEGELEIEDVKEVCEKLRGSFALSIYDSEGNNLYLLRYRNPLKIMQTDEGIVYASLNSMIRKGFGDETTNGTFIGEIEEEMIYKYDLDTEQFVRKMEFDGSYIKTKSTSYKGRSAYRNRNKGGYSKSKDSFSLKYFRKYDFKTKTPASTVKHNFEKCDCCGIYYKDSIATKAGKTLNFEDSEEEFHVCAFCYEGKENKFYPNYGISKEEQDNDEVIILSEEEFNKLSMVEQQNYIMCHSCNKYYKISSELVDYNNSTGIAVCANCQEVHAVK